MYPFFYFRPGFCFLMAKAKCIRIYIIPALNRLIPKDENHLFFLEYSIATTVYWSKIDTPAYLNFILLKLLGSKTVYLKSFKPT